MNHLTTMKYLTPMNHLTTMKYLTTMNHLITIKYLTSMNHFTVPESPAVGANDSESTSESCHTF